MRLRLLEYRGISALVICVVTVVTCALVAAWSHAGILVNAICILVVSLLGFHCAAWLSYERSLTWQSLDYGLELITVVSLIAALAGIHQSAVAEILQGAYSGRKAEQASLVYQIKTTITNDCHPKQSRKEMWTPAPEPYQGACDRLEHLLDQIEYSFSQETGVDTMTTSDSWARDLLINEGAAVRSWSGLYAEARRFIEGSRKTKEVVDAQRRLSSRFVTTLAGSEKLQYWQYLLVFAFGLRIANKTGRLLEARAKERRPDGASEAT